MFDALVYVKQRPFRSRSNTRQWEFVSAQNWHFTIKVQKTKKLAKWIYVLIPFGSYSKSLNCSVKAAWMGIMRLLVRIRSFGKIIKTTVDMPVTEWSKLFWNRCTVKVNEIDDGIYFKCFTSCQLVSTYKDAVHGVNLIIRRYLFSWSTWSLALGLNDQ